MLTDVLDLLACPVCGAGLAPEERALRCASGHAFDIARQGYVNLLTGDARPGTADTPEMIRAREAFLGAGHFAPLADALAAQAAEALPPAGRILDAGAGTGYYLARLLDRAPGAVGLAVDASKHAIRRAARAHPRIGAVVADLWRPLPVRAAAVDAIINVFAPRNGPEYRRVLTPDGLLHVVTPTSRHLGRLIPELGLLTVDGRKRERLDRALGAHFVHVATTTVETEAVLDRDEVLTLVAMGPSARHVSAPRLHARLAELPAPIRVPLSVSLATYRPARHPRRDDARDRRARSS